MKMLWVLFTIGLTFADKLDRTYLPPPGSTYSGGSLGATNVPLEQPKTKYSSNDERKTPELVIGIDRVGPNQVVDTLNYNSFDSPTETTSTIFKQSSVFPQVEENSTPPNSFHDFDNTQQYHNVEKDPSISIFDEYNRVYLPPYSEDIDYTKHKLSSIIPSPIKIENVKSDEYKYNQSDFVSAQDNEHSSSLHSTNQPFDNSISTVPSILLPNYPYNINNSMKSNDYNSTTKSQIFPTNLIKTIDKEHYELFDKISAQRPERIQAESDRKAVIINYGQTITPESYAYGYDTSNGIHADEEGTATNGVKAKGSYSYIGDDGNVYEVVYTADENGFLPKGAHLPTAPPIPDLILKVIEQAVRDKEAGVYDDGSYDEDKYGHKKYQGGNPQTNKIINEVDFTPENEINMESSNEFIENGDSQNIIAMAIENNSNEFKNNFDPKAKPNQIQDNYRAQNNDIHNINLPNINLNYSEHSSLQPENKLLSNKLTDYFGTIPKTDVSISDKSDMIDQNKPSGYEYFPPASPYYDTNMFQSIPSRFLGIDEDFYLELKENNTEKVTAKPFLTPYVSRKGDDPEINDFYFEEDQENDGNDPIHSNYSQANAEPIENLTDTDKEFNILKFRSRQPPQFGKRIQNHLVSPDKEGYFYQNANKPFITLNPRVSYTSSTAAPTEFPSLISTTQQVTSGRDQSASQTNTTPFINTSSTKFPISSLPTQTISPIILNKSTPTYPGVYNKMDLISTPKSIQTSRPELLPEVSRLSMTYRPSTSIANYPDKNNGQTSTENVIGEDFSGPKQSQRIDPITGYHY